MVLRPVIGYRWMQTTKAAISRWKGTGTKAQQRRAAAAEAMELPWRLLSECTRGQADALWPERVALVWAIRRDPSLPL